MLLAAGIISTIGALVGVLLTAVTLPGIWLMCLVALACTVWQPHLYSPWTLGAALLLAVLGEVAEGLSSAAGSAKTGGSKAGVVGSLVGSFVGLILGTIFLSFLPIIGSILGGIAGAGVGAALAEKGVANRTWGESLRSAKGAAVGRALATVIKTAIAALTAGLLIVDAFWN
ncbi:MAG: DUF456 domain-containing protein [Phycisphaeraceae bacterium]|nr:MAG: DUF456 domain-containing protein [Phycisphaeraceae bacterium]